VTLVLTFLVGDALMFYFMFEITLIPTLLIILGWGYQPERIQAGVYFLFYTLGASLPLLFLILSLFNDVGSLMFYILGGSIRSEIFFVGVFLFGAFLVKLPMFLVHLWLPRAHVEAPVAGSMILAGVLLKLGGYGILRLSSVSFLLIKFLGQIFIVISLLGMVVVGLMCIRFNDLKILVAYSSVAHIGSVIIGLFVWVYWGVYGGLLIILAHGVCSSGLFALVNLFYERTGRRRIFVNKGIINLFGVWSFIFFMLRVINISSPPTLNLLAEISIIGSLVLFSWGFLFLFALGSFLAAVYTLIWYRYSQHGGRSLYLSSLGGRLHRESHIIMMHLIPLNLIFVGLLVFL